MSTTPTQENWEREVREEFDNDLLQRGFFNKYGKSVSKDIADFWLNKLTSYKKELREKIEKLKKDVVNYPNGTDYVANALIDDVLSLLSDNPQEE